MSNAQPVHQPVMLEEVLDVMPIHDSGFYIDGTFGRGGHSRALLSRLGPEARLTGIDRDPQAVATGRELERADARFHIVASRFDCIGELAAAEERPLMGVLLDLGVSSPQLDDANRGFSFLRNGPLD
ncbi:MAG: 16S rRNA (cytosine(1402)-N(4))-methyltransferase, partial [Oleiphilaceae bacterium]|nr:16S rRNA (cytosine(1402)-N(4))-methyltransferase [Oleiphilaceae bacterium]